MSDTQPDRRPALKLNPNQTPAFTADDMKANLQGAAVVLVGTYTFRTAANSGPATCPTAEEIYDASTGRLLVVAAGTLKPRPGF